MTQDLKIFKGNFIWKSISGSRGIRRRLVWDADKSRYGDPVSGSLYEVRKVMARGGARVSKSFSSLAEAREWQSGRTFEKVRSSAAQSSIESYVISDLVADFKLRRYPFLSEGTIILYERRLQSLAPLMSRTVDSLTSKDISDWIDWLRRPERLAMYSSVRTSFEKELRTLGSLLRWHLEENDEATLVFPIKSKHFERAYLKKRKARSLILSEADLSKWLAVLKAHNQIFYTLAVVQVFQALRVSEVCAMKWSHLDSIDGRYQISEHVIWPRVGGRPPQLVQGTKTSREPYLIPLWKEVQAALEALSKSESDLIFNENGQLLTYRKVQHAYDRAFEIAGLPHRGTHVCRHTGSTVFLHRTQDLLALQQLGNWKDQHMPQHYAKVVSSRLETAMRETERRLKIVN